MDDEEFVRVVAQRALELAGYNVVTAATGAEAAELEQRRGRELDLMLIDLAMPVMGGTEAIARIRADRPDLPMAVMTGFGDDATLERAARLGVEVIEKPFRADQLADRVESILRAHVIGAKRR
ncbi:MAG TPA: response regulator [Gemmatimonadales bacterium]|nr:response regulator [Gemmatimonadales bacterium]